MIIPKKFKLLKKTIAVKYDKNLVSKKKCYGMTWFHKNKIILQPLGNGSGQTKRRMEITFLHELIHRICYYTSPIIQHKMGDDHLYLNEQFVEFFTSLLHEALTTAEYK